MTLSRPSFSLNPSDETSDKASINSGYSETKVCMGIMLSCTVNFISVLRLQDTSQYHITCGKCGLAVALTSCLVASGRFLVFTTPYLSVTLDRRMVRRGPFVDT